MPTYEYECTNCGHVFEMTQSIKAKPKRKPDEPCAGCGVRAPIRRLIGTGAAVLFKGSGFYETDYRSDGYKKAAKAEKEAASGGGDSTKGDSSKTKTDKKGAAEPVSKPSKADSASSDKA